MITLYVASSCSSSRKARKWLVNHHLIFNEINLTSCGIKKEALLKMLALSEHGIKDIIAYRGKVVKELEIDVNLLTLKEALFLIEKRPQILRHPLILSEKHFQVGYNEENIRTFLPRHYREASRNQLL